MVQPRTRSPHHIDSGTFQKKMVTDMYTAIKEDPNIAEEEEEEIVQVDKEEEISDKED